MLFNLNSLSIPLPKAVFNMKLLNTPFPKMILLKTPLPKALFNMKLFGTPFPSSDVNRPVGRSGTVGRPRFLQDGRDGTKAVRPVLTPQ